MQKRYENTYLKHALKLVVKAQTYHFGVLSCCIKDLSFVLGYEKRNLSRLLIMKSKQKLTLLQ